MACQVEGIREITRSLSEHARAIVSPSNSQWPRQARPRHLYWRLHLENDWMSRDLETLANSATSVLDSFDTVRRADDRASQRQPSNQQHHKGPSLLRETPRTSG